MKPVLKWVGGKRKLVPHLLRHLPADAAERRHVEPFAGGAAFFFAREPQRACLNDINRALVMFYETVMTHAEEVIRGGDALAEDYREDPAAEYYVARSLWNKGLYGPGPHAASMFLFLNKTCFNGIWRVNKKGEFNVPMGRYKNPTIVDADALRAAAALLQGVHLAHGDFAELDYADDDLVYFDPPYVPLTPTSNFTSYAKEGFGLRQQQELATLFRRLSDRGIPCLLSNSDTPLVRELYAGFPVEEVRAARAINSDASKRGSVGELIVSNAACATGRFDTRGRAA